MKAWRFPEASDVASSADVIAEVRRLVCDREAVTGIMGSIVRVCDVEVIEEEVLSVVAILEEA